MKNDKATLTLINNETKPAAPAGNEPVVQAKHLRIGYNTVVVPDIGTNLEGEAVAQSALTVRANRPSQNDQRTAAANGAGYPYSGCLRVNHVRLAYLGQFHASGCVAYSSNGC
jgi:hypothetical protein